MSNAKKTILIIEDEPSLLWVLGDKFSRDEGFNVLKAKNGEEGLNLALKKHPDLILLDIVMPKMDGIAVLKKLREDNWGKTVEVIMLTNLSGTEKIQEAKKYGSFEYLVKSNWTMADIAKKLKEKLGM